MSERENGGGGRYNQDLDDILAEWKAREGNEGIKVQLISYDGAAPKVKVERWYLDRNDEWKRDTKRVFPRFGMQMLAWLMQATGELEKGMEVYQRKHGKGTGSGAAKGGGRDEF